MIIIDGSYESFVSSTEHVKIVLARFLFLSWQDGVYAFFAGLVMNFGFLVAALLAYWLLLRTVRFIGRKW